jgi:Rieske Fe-S protein
MQGTEGVCAHLGCPPIIDWPHQDVNIFWPDPLT